MRLDRFLAEMGISSRSELKKEIRRGQVLLNGEEARDPSLFVDPENPPVILYRGREFHYEAFSYYMMNKPAGVLSASRDKKQSTVLDLIRENRRRDLFPVGRLDKDCEGLLLISNDGPLSHRLLRPKSHVPKLYFVRVSGRLTESDAELFRRGLRYDEDLTALPAELTILSAEDIISEACVRITEGKFHQIKKMFLALPKKKEVLFLKRIAFGPLRLDEALKPGEYRKLKEAEISALKEVPSSAPEEIRR